MGQQGSTADDGTNYVATDACGNTSEEVSVTVTVPFDQRNKKG